MWLSAQQTNPDGSLRPAQPVTRLFTQDAYTEYAILEPGSEQFRIRFLPEETRAGATELVNATRGGSEGSGVEVYDPRTGKPLKFTYEQQGNDPENHAIRATLPIPVPEGGIGRVLIYKTYKDPRTYMMHGEDIVWVRSLAGYRLGVLLPKGFAFISSNVAAQLTTLPDGRLKLAFANPSGQSNPVTIRARPTTATFTALPYVDMFFDDIKTLYDLDAPEGHTIRVEQTYSDYRKGDKARLDSLEYLALADLKVVDLDTAKVLDPVREGKTTAVKLEVPIVDDKQSAHLKITGTLERCRIQGAERRTGFRPHAARTAQHRAAAGGLGRGGGVAVGHDRHVSGPGVRGADQSERREQLPRDHSRAQAGIAVRPNRRPARASKLQSRARQQAELA